MRLGANVQVVGGGILGLLGIVFTLQNFGLLAFGDVQLFWPMLVVAFGLSRLFERSGRPEGVVLLILGAGVQLSNLGVFDLPPRETARYWPLAVVLVGIWEAAFSARIRTMIEGLTIAFLGIWLQLSYFGIVHISSYRAWPLVLVAVGGVMVWRGFVAGRVSEAVGGC